MEIKQKYKTRITIIIENEINNIFNFDNDTPDLDYEREKIIENHVDEMLDEIKKIME